VKSFTRETAQHTVFMPLFLAKVYSEVGLHAAATAAVHDRMPVILDPDSYDLWLDPGFTDVAAASDMLKPFDAAAMRAYPVSGRVSNVANDDAECCAPVEAALEQARCSESTIRGWSDLKITHAVPELFHFRTFHLTSTTRPE
jgi:hypothetical protein